MPEEDQVPNRNSVVVIGYGLWQRQFDSDPGVIGKTITINDHPECDRHGARRWGAPQLNLMH